MKVLIVEDDSFACAVYESELRQENIEVVLASNGREGLDKAKEHTPDLIITELILTKINGFELIKEIRQDPALSKTPIVVVSALGQKQDIDEAMSMGVNKYLPKELYSSKQVIKEVVNLMMSLL